MLKSFKLKKFEVCAAVVALSYIVFFMLRFIIKGNKEFSFYALGIVALFFFFLFTVPRLGLSPFVLWGFVLMGLFHFLGGSVHISGVRLYDFVLFDIVDLGGEFVLLKYDQAMHFFSTFFVFLGLSQIYDKNFNKKTTETGKKGFKKIYWVLLFAAFGIASAIEIVEFFPAFFLEAHGVGGYVNTLLDLCSNFLGALFGMIWLTFFSKNG